MDASEKLIHLYNQLDEYLRIKHFNNNVSYTSYSRKIYYIKKHRLEPIFENNKEFDMIKKAGEIRNIIVHNNDLVVPSEEFLNQFESLVERITMPQKVEEVMTRFNKLKTADLSERLGNVVNVLKEYGFASVPILENNEVIGFFTEKTLFDYLTLSDRLVDKDMRIKDLIEVINFDQKPRAYFKFIPRDMTVDEAYQFFMEDFKDKHELMLLLVTEHGKETESLLGIVALRDLKNVLY
jgi:CBS domain-containing protein